MDDFVHFHPASINPFQQTSCALPVRAGKTVGCRRAQNAARNRRRDTGRCIPFPSLPFRFPSLPSHFFLYCFPARRPITYTLHPYFAALGFYTYKGSTIMMTETIGVTVDARLTDYIAAHHAACDAMAASARQRAADNQANERARVAALASRPKARARRVGAAWRSLPIVSRSMVPWESMPMGLRLELAAVPERIRLDVAGSALILAEAHAGDPLWPVRRIVKRALGQIIDEKLGRYDAGVSRRVIADHETALTDREIRDLSGSVSSVLQSLVDDEDAAVVDPRPIVTAALVRSLPHGEAILVGLMAGKNQREIAEEIGTPNTTLFGQLARVHRDASALLS